MRPFGVKPLNFPDEFVSFTDELPTLALNRRLFRMGKIVRLRLGSVEGLEERMAITNEAEGVSIVRPIEFDRWSSVAICASRLDDFRTCQGMATTTACRNILISKDLQPKTRGIVPVQFRPDRYKWLRAQEIRQTTKKQRDPPLCPAGLALVSQGERPGIGGTNRPKAGNNRVQNGRF
jgi:hypothetical protein